MRYPRGYVEAAALALAVTTGGAAGHAAELVWARYGDIDSLDPHRATSTLSMQVWDQIYETKIGRAHV